MVGKKVSLRRLEMLRVGNNYLLCKLHSHFETIWVGLKTFITMNAFIITNQLKWFDFVGTGTVFSSLLSLGLLQEKMHFI